MFNPSLIGLLGAALLVSASAVAAPAKKPPPRAPKAATKAAPPVAAPAAPAVELNPGQLEAASRVLTGAVACEFNQNLTVMPVDGKPGYFTLVIKKTTYTLVPQETTTGAVRLEDRGAGVVWLQIPAKSMLLNTRNGQRLVDSCQHEEQRLATAKPDSGLGIVEVALATSGGLPAVQAALPGAATQPPLAQSPLTQPPLIARQLLFGSPRRSAGSISPDGQWLAWLAALDGVPNLWVAPAATPQDARPVTNDRQRGISSFAFARDGKHLLFVRDEDGDENLQVVAVDLAGGALRALSPKGSRATIAGLSDAQGGEVLLSVNDRDPKQFDLVRVVIASGERTRVIANDGYSRIVTDARFGPRYASRQRPDGGSDWFVRDGDAWRPWSTLPSGDAPGTTANSAATDGIDTIGSIAADGRTLYLSDSRGRKTAALYAVDTTTGTRQLLLDGVRAGADGVMLHPVTGLVQAVRSGEAGSRWVAIDPAIAADLQRLETLAAGADFAVTARTRNDTTWVVTVTQPDAAAKIYLYERNGGNGNAGGSSSGNSSGNPRLWYDSRPAWAGLPLAPTRPLQIITRTGLVMPAALTLPQGMQAGADGKPARPLPMVLLLHGAPLSREAGSLNDTRQWLANRGYAVLSVGSSAPAAADKALPDASALPWRRQMQEQLLDAAAWAAAGGIAQRDKVALMGGSLGDVESGQAALTSLAMTPKEFACAVAFVGPSKLPALLETVPRSVAPIGGSASAAAGGPDKSAGRARPNADAPQPDAQPSERPLLIGRGSGSPAVEPAPIGEIASAMRARAISPTYLLYPDEGRRLVRAANRISFNAAAEQFLAACLGGRAEAVGDDFKDASIQVLIGADKLPAVQASLSMPLAPPAAPAR